MISGQKIPYSYYLRITKNLQLKIIFSLIVYWWKKHEQAKIKRYNIFMQSHVGISYPMHTTELEIPILTSCIC